ncbi:MAG: hypothetical protein IT555_04480 [Acetobacteraceae bacterium]|nr:hypothetical protein [Acetobacteraceae bacterium]
MPHQVAYLLISGAATAACAPDILRGLVRLGFPTVICIPSPNTARVVAFNDLAAIPGVTLAESYFDAAIRPRPPHGVVLFAPCSFNSLNKLAAGIADTLTLAVAAEAIGRRTPVIVAPSLNQPLLDHPIAQASLRTLPTWGVTLVPQQATETGPRLAPTETLLAAIAPHAPNG